MISNLKIKKRIFIVGAARSGTTLLQSMIASHPEIYSFPETHFFTDTIPVHVWQRPFKLHGRKDRIFVSSYLRRINAGKFENLLPDVTMSNKRWTRGLLSILDALALENGASIWLEKTPMHLYYIDVITSVDPNAIFIHTIRNGEDVVASIYDVSHKKPEFFGGERTIDQCITRWKYDVKISSNYARVVNHFIIKYESLVESPEMVLKSLFKHLDIVWSEAALDYKSKAAKLTFPEEAWKAKNTGEIQVAKKFDTIFSHEEQHYIRKELSKASTQKIDENAL